MTRHRDDFAPAADLGRRPRRGTAPVLQGHGCRRADARGVAAAAASGRAMGGADGRDPHANERRPVAQGDHRLSRGHPGGRHLRRRGGNAGSTHQRDCVPGGARGRAGAHRSSRGDESALQRGAVHRGHGVHGSHHHACRPHRFGIRTRDRGRGRRRRRPVRVVRGVSGARSRSGHRGRRRHARSHRAGVARAVRGLHAKP